MPALELIEKYYNTDWTHRKQVFMTASSHCLQNYVGDKNIWSKLFSDASLVGGDTLTCGECKKDFKLQELTLFIQHKALNSCKRLKVSKSPDSEYNEVGSGNIWKKHQILFLFVPRSSRAHPRTEIMYLLVLPASLVQVENISPKLFINISLQSQDKLNVTHRAVRPEPAQPRWRQSPATLTMSRNISSLMLRPTQSPHQVNHSHTVEASEDDTLPAKIIFDK